MTALNTTIVVRTARRAHNCERCRTDGTIRRGHRYLRHVAFPGSSYVGDGTRPETVNQCIGHAAEEDDYAPLQHGACGTYCCSVEPCALPHPHRGDHSCRNCPQPPSQDGEQHG